MLNNKNFNKSLSKATFIFRIFGLQYFTFSSNYKSLGYQENSISRKFKISLAVVLTLILTQIGYLIWVLLAVEKRDIENFRQAFYMGVFAHFNIMAFLLLSVVHAYITTSDVKTVLKHCVEIAKILEKSLMINSDYDEFGRTFQNFCIKFVTALLPCTLFLIGYTYMYDTKELLNVITLQVFPYTFIEVIILKFIFFVMLVDHNAQRLQIFFCIKIKEKENDKIRINFSTMDLKDLEKIISVKEIYGLMLKMTRLINNISGLTISIFFLIFVLGSSLAGYMIFLVTKNVVPFGLLGSVLFSFKYQ